MTSSSRSNDLPATTTDEKWVEYGTRGGHGTSGGGRPPAYASLVGAGDSGYGPSSSSAMTSSSSKHFSEKTVGFSDSTRPYGVDPGLKQTQMEFMNPVNTTTILSKFV